MCVVLFCDTKPHIFVVRGAWQKRRRNGGNGGHRGDSSTTTASSNCKNARDRRNGRPSRRCDEPVVGVENTASNEREGRRVLRIRR